jgi:hypothetical protein
MADAQIPGITVPCLVIQKNNQQFIENSTIIGQTLYVPCRNVFYDEVPYWAVPVKNDGVFSQIQWIMQRTNNSVTVPQPTFDSFLCFRIRDKISFDTWWIYGTLAQFLNACATCCGAGSTPMPGIDGQFAPIIAPCQDICKITNSQGQYIAIFGIPNVLGPDTWYPVGSYNNVAFPAASPSGYSTPALLLAYLNASWNSGGGHTITWSLSSDNLTLTATVPTAVAGDLLCIIVVRIGPSS